tara:strand:+ start:1453 stop:1833 length:381 start_codon:yes stop_codon:yes gene_type:complete
VNKKTARTIDEFTIDIGSTTQTEQNMIDSFNNKGQKGDDDFETWLENEAPFVPVEDNKYTISIGDTTYDTCATACTSTIMSGSITGLSPTFTIKDMPHFAPTKQKKLPIDLLHKWYPEQMKEINDE